MTRLTLGRLVQFRDGDAWMVGNVIEAPCGEFGVLECNEFRLVRTTPGAELVIVKSDLLSAYPSSPIPEPANTGRAG